MCVCKDLTQINGENEESADSHTGHTINNVQV